MSKKQTDNDDKNSGRDVLQRLAKCQWKNMFPAASKAFIDVHSFLAGQEGGSKLHTRWQLLSCVLAVCEHVPSDDHQEAVQPGLLSKHGH